MIAARSLGFRHSKATLMFGSTLCVGCCDGGNTLNAALQVSARQYSVRPCLVFADSRYTG
jgi:hypothetical protein